MSATNFFASLTKGVKAALSYLRGAAATSATPTEILTTARSLGYSFRTQQALDVIGILRGFPDVTTQPGFQSLSPAQQHVLLKQQNQRSIRTTDIHTPLDPRRYIPMKGGLNNYSYLVSRTIRGMESGTTDNNYVTVSSNEPLSVQQILDTALSYTSGTCNPLQEEIIVDEINVEAAFRR